MPSTGPDVDVPELNIGLVTDRDREASVTYTFEPHNPAVDANQQSLRNPFGMDEECPNCPALVESRERVVHGYGDVGAEFLFVGERPDPVADETGIPFADDSTDSTLWKILDRLGFVPDSDSDPPGLQNAYITHLTRCRHPDRPPTDEEIDTCEPFLNAEIRMINPEIIVPVGQRTLRTIAADYTTKPPESFDIERDHATEIRGRGFELLPMIESASLTPEAETAFVEAFSGVLDRDYRQTKGRRGR